LNEKQTILSASTSPTDELDVPDDSEVELREFQIPSELHGERVDRALAVLLPEFSRSYAKQLLEEGAVALLGETPQAVQKASAKVKTLERYLVTLRPTTQSQAFKPEAMALNIVFEDEHLRIIHKPTGLVVHPAPGNWSGTLLNGLLALDDKAVMLPRAGIVHRLDKDTSGLMVVAKTRVCMDALVSLIGDRAVHREYLTVGYRAWNGPRVREVEAGIGRDTRNRLRMAVVDLDRVPGKTAHTTLACLGSNEAACLIHCTLHTGRTHQIRVHMAHIGHPLLGDALYAGPMQMGIQRQALHAFRLSFEHPVTQAALRFEAPLPADMTSLLLDLGLELGVVESM
jgi:23S rRNA pseudouridine1911/1915/1917 synthase